MRSFHRVRVQFCPLSELVETGERRLSTASSRIRTCHSSVFSTSPKPRDCACQEDKHRHFRWFTPVKTSAANAQTLLKWRTWHAKGVLGCMNAEGPLKLRLRSVLWCSRWGQSVCGCRWSILKSNVFFLFSFSLTSNGLVCRLGTA